MERVPAPWPAKRDMTLLTEIGRQCPLRIHGTPRSLRPHGHQRAAANDPRDQDTIHLAHVLQRLPPTTERRPHHQRLVLTYAKSVSLPTTRTTKTTKKQKRGRIVYRSDDPAGRSGTDARPAPATLSQGHVPAVDSSAMKRNSIYLHLMPQTHDRTIRWERRAPFRGHRRPFTIPHKSGAPL